LIDINSELSKLVLNSVIRLWKCS